MSQEVGIDLRCFVDTVNGIGLHISCSPRVPIDGLGRSFQSGTSSTVKAKVGPFAKHQQSYRVTYYISTAI